MKTFEGIRFDGTFRDYQQNILNHAQSLLRDKKIHIVAAPGSGKTILGLELIKRLGAPALIFSPSVTIKQQWAMRFTDNFLPETASPDDYISYTLTAPSLLTTVTYQALHAAVNKNKLLNENTDDDEDTESPSSEDFSDFDLYAVIKKNGIKTICLDEAHHLKSEWQKALETFIEKIKSDVTIISLTATPPYDSTPSEWNRYISLCGEIDDEIFVPALVAQKTLCPHQDFIYFNYPTKAESKTIIAYKQKATSCSEEIIHGSLLSEIVTASDIFGSYRALEEQILENAKWYIALLSVLNYAGVTVPSGLIKLLSPSKKLPKYTLSVAETAFQFVIDNPQFFSQKVSDELREKLSENGLIEKKVVCLNTNDKLTKQIISSLGKLDSIGAIVDSEISNLGGSLRMLILTDFIKSNLLKIVGTDEAITAMGTVPIFEAVRRRCGDNASLAMISGNLVIIPNKSADEICKIAESMGVTYKLKPIEKTTHSEIVFSGSNKNKVAVITEAFGKGLINILVGTKSLLGEGWDSPCINSLILASFVGSFMLSNQMRGRAIRTDKQTPGKVSNIWHLVTVEPTFDGVSGIFHGSSSQIESSDFETLKRRFDCFLAPAYERNMIESGVDRIDILKPPFNEKGYADINTKTLALAADRAKTAKSWQTALCGQLHPEIHNVDQVPNNVQPTGFLIRNGIYELILSICGIASIKAITSTVQINANPLSKLLILAILVVFSVIFLKLLFKILRFATPKKSVESLARCVLSTLKKMGEIDNAALRVRVEKAPESLDVICTLVGDSCAREKEVFCEALKEMLSPIDNPRYILIKKGFFGNRRSVSFACPSIIGAKKENVQLLASELRRRAGKFELFYTRNEIGRKELLKCRKFSYINVNDTVVSGKKVSQWQ